MKKQYQDQVRRIKKNKKFQPAETADGDECFPNGIFEFNITKMINHIKGNPDIFNPEPIALKYFPPEFSSINEGHMPNVCISDPVIIAEISPGRYNLIDGNHRMEKARRLGMETVMAYRLSMEEHVNFLTTYSAYEAYVKYWNDKINNFL